MHTDTMLTMDAVPPLLQQLFPKAAGVPRIAPLAADASTRRYFRIHWDAPAAGCLASCVLMVCEPWQPRIPPIFSPWDSTCAHMVCAYPRSTVSRHTRG